jgi:2-oxoisovalerate dehydrogenase E1 component
VFGHRELNVIPQTSTIASHLPRAVGLAFGLARADRLGVRGPWPAGSLVVASFGDASVNHSTAAGAINTACYCAYQGLPLPLLLVCEDNGLGISVRTPPGWVATALSGRPGLRYARADGADPAAVYDAAAELAEHVRERRSPAVLHLETIRLGGHAGSDVESGYRSAEQIAADSQRDPLLGTARLLVSAGLATPDQIIAAYRRSRAHVLELAARVENAPQLASAVEVMAPLAPRRPAAVASLIGPAGSSERGRAFGTRLPEDQGPLTLAQSINRALFDEMAASPRMLVFGEDVARKGGVYGVTRGLLGSFGAARVFDSLLDEQSILGLALGASLAGLLPVPEIQYLAYLHNAADQIRGEAATLSFFSQGGYRNPMVVRVAGLAYQHGFGGHFHNDNAVAALRDIPGLIIACPARPDDAAPMLRTCLASARADGSVCVFLEPIALYHERDLYEPGDGGWLAPYEPPWRWTPGHVPVGRARLHGDGADLTIMTFGNGLRMSLRAAATLAREGIGGRVLDLRWLAPLPADDVIREARATGAVLVADETRRSGGVAESVLAVLADHGFAGPVARVTSEDSIIPLGQAASTVLLSQRAIEDAARDLVQRRGAARGQAARLPVGGGRGQHLLAGQQRRPHRRPLDHDLGVLVELDAAGGRHRVQVRAGFLTGPGRVGHPWRDRRAALHRPGQHGPQHRVAHPRQVGQVLMPVLAHARVDLRHRLQAADREHVDQHADLDRVAGQERDREEDVPGRGELARERLHEAGQLGEEQVQRGLGGQLGDPAAAVGHRQLLLRIGAPVGGLDELNVRLRDQAADHPGDELAAEVAGVGVRERDDVAGGHRQAAPHRVALAVRWPVLRHQRVLRIDLDVGVVAGDVGGAVGRVGVHDDHLVDQADIRTPEVVDCGEHRADGLRDVAGRQDQRDRQATLALGPAQLTGAAEFAVGKAIGTKPVMRSHKALLGTGAGHSGTMRTVYLLLTPQASCKKGVRTAGGIGSIRF